MTLADFENVVTRHQTRVFGYALRILGDRDAAADAVQEAMLRLWRHRTTVTSDGAAGWLIRVTRNVCLDQLRERQRHHDRVRGDVEPDEGPDDRPLPDRVAASAVLRAYLERALAQLSEPYRSIVILREIEDYRYDEIGEALQLPMTTVKVYLHRGRRMLRNSLTEVMNGETA